jgi:hypothetical protein
MKPINRTIGTPARLSLALGLLAAALGVASAAPLPPQPGQAGDQSLITQVKKGKHHGYRPWVGIGGAIVVGTAYCTAQAASCAEEYGARTYRYWRCLRRAGCDW